MIELPPPLLVERPAIIRPTTADIARYGEDPTLASMLINPFIYGGAAGGDPDFASVILLAGFEGTDAATTAVDDSNSAHTLTFNGNAQLDDSVTPPFGTTALSLDGSGDAVTIADHADFNFGTGDWTFEMFVRPNALANNAYLLAQWVGSGSNEAFNFRGSVDGSLTFQFSNNGTGSNNISTAAGAIAANTWTHVAVERSGINGRVYAGGAVLVTSNVLGTNPIFNSTLSLRIGNRDGLGTGFNGRIKELRMTKGVARYNGSPYTPPTAPYSRT